ncbi:hypothetical protein DGMP_31320 [Desulfomarina profundi]|uniref:AMP-dependent synthetase/ligase domain-containing protein n=1 Tax=Desulfomarina profundi TaxID=2772557 RepID=A0A8D5FVI5_9BACT|nr:AMP-binding protein [Desulfomarina profundi]BCL62439.1 hypothetical protein DGMP_31320 [Desulfomarina profundi]
MTTREELVEYSIPQLLRWRVRSTPKRPALREKDFGIWNTYSWEDYYSYVRRTALGLRAIGLGKNDTIAIISDNIPELLFIAIGGHSLGAISAGIYQTSMPDEIAQIIDYLKVSAVFCDNQEQVDKVLEVRDRIPGVKKVIFEDPRGCGNICRMTGSLISVTCIKWGKRNIIRIRISSSRWWIGANLMMSVISALHLVPPAFPRGP